jgi:DNA polymerase III epsilon subunit-like protein
MTGICAIDTETTSLRADRRAWEVGIVARIPGRPDTEHHWFIDAGDLDLGNADVMSLKIGRFYERHPQMRLDRECDYADYAAEADALREIEAVTRGAHLVGAVVSFDADVLGQRMRAHGICPSWHYHLIDVEAMAAGYLAGSFHAIQEVGKNPEADGPTLEEARCAMPPWKSDELSRAIGVEPDDFDRHTALGDARWAQAIYDAILGGAS